MVDPALWEPAGAPRRAWLVRSLARLAEDLDGALVVRHGDPRLVVPQVVDELGVPDGRVHVTADAGPYGRQRDEAVAAALAATGGGLVRTGTPYAVGPGRVTKADGTPYQVFTPFSRAWADHGWPAPAPGLPAVRWARSVESQPLPDEPGEAELDGLELPAVGEAAAFARWQEFRADRLADYATARDRPDLAGTSALSAHLKYGEIHPRTLLADLADLAGRRGAGAQTFRHRAGLAGVLCRRPLAPAGLGARLPTGPSWPGWSGLAPGRRRRPGGRAARGTPSWTPGCASCGPRAGCTTGSG